MEGHMPATTRDELTKRAPRDPSDLLRRLSRKIQVGKTMQMRAEDLDLLVVSGAYERLSEYTEKYLREVAEARLSARESGG
jgi:hypothetical protein